MRSWRNRWLWTVLVSIIWLCTIAVLYLYLTRRESPRIRNAVHELLWWTDDLHWNYDEMRHCGFDTCRVTNNHKRLHEARAILFYGSNMKVDEFPMPRSGRHLWGLLHEESPRNVPFVPYTEFLRHFNYTSTFSRYSDLPLTTQYLPHPSDLTQLDYQSTFLNKQRHQFNEQLASVVFLQTDCNTMSGREDYVRELMKHIQVDSYGSCLHNRDLPEQLQNDYLNNLYSDALLRFLSPYKFMIAIENGVCEDYITEKFWRPLMAGIIPIYFGSPSIRNWQPQNQSAIYIDEFPNASALAAHLQQVGGNESAYNAYLGHKFNRRQPIQNPLLVNHLLMRGYQMRRSGELSNEDSLFHKFECLMCRRAAWTDQRRPANKRHYNCPLPPVYAPLEQQKEPKYAADWRSMMGVGRCQAQLLDAFWRANIPYTKAEFDARLSEMMEQNKCN
ncbi:alpha-(1,3)-fucosyltransferase B [Drosophila grimshawi]|uniref:Fucosyltransferase n=1 Tax=Drosophila grimshawi TaxID=7222 RepID=B4JPW0_DROGR|nr:alpha-(1,3)-fucosyltransferase B [Drosophila grimshawi]EDV98940.1 GH13596 [Drosophila grimshawi]